jgi:heme/copper-type cytochrome/quinol oxidase subunit 3
MIEVSAPVNQAPNENQKLSNVELFFLIGLASWAMLFAAFILSFLLARMKAPIWPPKEVEGFPSGLAFISTIALGLSSYFLTKAVKAWEIAQELKSYYRAFKFYWDLAIALGIFFGILQYAVFSQWVQSISERDTHFLDIRANVYSSSVAFLILFHGVHFIGGLGGLVWKLIKPQSLQSLKLWMWFWHFLGIVWLAIFLAIAL